MVDLVPTWYDPLVTGLVMSHVRDDDALSRWYGVVAACQLVDFVGLPADPIEEIRPALAGRYGDEDFTLHLGEVEGVPVVAVVTRLPVHDNVTLANVGLRVHPDHRRRGYGRAALEVVLDELKSAGRTTVLFEVPDVTRGWDPSAGMMFAASVGARRMLVAVRRMLDVTGIPESRLAALHDEARAASAGYSVLTWRDHTPSEYVEDMAALRALMSTDPPQGDLELEPEQWDAERYLSLERSYIERGRLHLVAAVRAEETGQLVGYTDLGVPSGGGTVGYQWDTIVRSDHRGRRLGLLVKLANLAELRRALPEVRYLNTWNAEENAHMVGVNERLGYRPMERWSEMQLTL